MALMSLMQYAEGPKCRVDALLANDIQGLVGALAGAREIQQAQNEVIANPRELVHTVVSRISKLLDKEPEQGENHPYDAAIAAYLFVLSRASESGLEKAFEKLRTIKRSDIPWTAMMCRRILQNQGAPSSVLADYWTEPKLANVRVDLEESTLSTKSDSSNRFESISRGG